MDREYLIVREILLVNIYHLEIKDGNAYIAIIGERSSTNLRLYSEPPRSIDLIWKGWMM